jgi:AhpD family alkylhydroperoxidase
MSDYMYKSNIKEDIALLKDISPPYHSSWTKLHDAVFEDGALSKKEKALIAVAGAHITRCPYCIRARVVNAKKLGASDAEIVEAIYVAMRFAMGAPYAYSSIAFETYNALEKGASITEGHFFSKNIAKEIGEFKEASGPISKPFMEFHETVFGDGALSKKMKRAIIGLAVAHMTRCPWCIRGCVRDAITFGVTREQMAEAINVAMIMSAGACYAHAGIAMDSLRAVAPEVRQVEAKAEDIECGC